MDISVVIPFYNGESFIEEAVDSVLNQTYQAKEILIINDSPSEASKKFLARFESHARVIHLDRNHGISCARNIGIQNSKYEWIAFLDNDDVWVTNKLEQQKAYLTNNPDVSACHTGVEVFSKEGVIEQCTDKPQRLTMGECLSMSHVLPSSLLIKKASLKEAGFFDRLANGSEDRALTIKLLEAGIKIDFISEVLMRFRREGQNNFSKQWKPKFKAHMYIFRKHFVEFRKYKLIRSYLNWTFSHAAFRSTGMTSIFFKCMAKLF